MSAGSDDGEGERLREEARVYGLEDRTFEFARAVRTFIRALPRSICNLEDARQLVRSSGSVGANFIEATEAVGAKDYVYRLKISRKEAKESRYWLRLLHLDDRTQETPRQALIDEAGELVRILTSLAIKSSSERR